MKPATRVRLLSDPGRSGLITGKCRSRGTRIFWQVHFSEDHQYIAEEQLEVIPDEREDALDFFQQGKFGRTRDLRSTITHIRLSGRLADLIYSMGTTHTDFHAYQFKPVINFLDSPSKGILIADEVGLGKTIEAGLIWTELRSRYATRRLMVLCPAMLREKWKSELQRRFGISSQMVDARETLGVLKDYQAGVINEFALIASMQGLRPRRGWASDDTLINNPASSLARFLEDNANDEPLLDLLIIDEAHYLRNPSSMTSALGRLLRDVTDHIVLLTATPVHLRNQDLYVLLNLVDENSFDQVHVFDDILQANAPLHQARDMVLHGEYRTADFLNILKQAQSHQLLRHNRQLQNILENPPAEQQLQNDKGFRSELAHQLEKINLLGRVVTRTRRREVQEMRVVRDPVREAVDLTPLEYELYQRVTEIVRQYCLQRHAHEGFLLVTPQRQISSSMPAALREWQKRKFAFDNVDEDLGTDIENTAEVGPLVQAILSSLHELPDLEALWNVDSKYNRFYKRLREYLETDPQGKVIVFAYFRPTLFYLHERLSAEGIDSLVLVGGGTDDKYAQIEKFASPEGPGVLLASEVASEGVDLQFSRVVVNYDLPWNPMKVEQRIGRIDRLGQKSSKITIWNLFHADTIDSRICERLHERLGIFEYALGGLEAVLGDEIRKMTLDLFRGTLTREQEDIRILQTEQALSNRRREEERLEQNAQNLMAHGDYILQQVNAVRNLGRWISGEDIWVYVRDYFTTFYTGCEFQQLQADELLFDVKLSDAARSDYRKFLQDQQITGHSAIAFSSYKPVRCHFKNQVLYQTRGSVEQINQFHPLLRFVAFQIQEHLKQSDWVHFPAVSLRLNQEYIPELSRQDYLFFVDRWIIKGVKVDEHLVYCARPAAADAAFLSEVDAEKLVTAASQNGVDWLSASNEMETASLLPLMEACMDETEKRYKHYIAIRQNENTDRADFQEKTLKLHLSRQRDKLQQQIKRLEAEGKTRTIPATQGKIKKLEAIVEDRLRDIEQGRRLEHHSKGGVCLGVIRVE